MSEFYAETRAIIWGSEYAWSTGPSPSIADASKEVTVLLSIQGNDRDGYLLVQSPEGFFTADNFHPTLEEAIEQAWQLFGVNAEAWREKEEPGAS